MKTRIIVGIALALFAIGLVVLIGFGYSQYISILIAIASAICVYEILHVSGCKNKVLTAISMIFSACVSVVYGFGLNEKFPLPAGVIAGIYVLCLLILMLKMYDKTKFENVAMSIFSSICIPMSLDCIIFTDKLIDKFPGQISHSTAVFLVLISMYCAWLSDTFALFFGRAYGKHKMAPKISPKKSYEGAVAGVVGTTVISLITYFIFWKWYFPVVAVKWWMMLIYVPVCCVMGMLGDLSASVIKRNFGFKDFGTLFPEHGGMMDRIDSFLFTMPTTFIALTIFTSAAF